jgi:hypothetical protein
VRSRTAKKIVRKGIGWKGRTGTRREAYLTYGRARYRWGTMYLNSYRAFLAEYLPHISKLALDLGNSFSLAARLLFQNTPRNTKSPDR